jgi:hypothetical protein
METKFFEMQLTTAKSCENIGDIIKLPYVLIPGDIVTLPSGAYEVIHRGIAPSPAVPYYLVIFVKPIL